MRAPFITWAGAGILLIFIAAHSAGWYWFLHVFPRGYNWSELLVNYQGGFVKRGLVGEAAFHLKSVISPVTFIASLLFAAYVAVTAILIIVLRVHTTFPGLLFLISPAGWLFPLLTSAAYGRKDVFVVLAAVCSLAIIMQQRGKNATLITIMAMFAVPGLIVEISWFYFPIIFATFLVGRQDESLLWRLGASAAAAAYTLGCELLFLLAGPVDTAAIAASWNHVPFTNNDTGALCCLNFTFRNAFEFGREPLPSIASYCVMMIFGSLPLVLLILKKPLRRIGLLCGSSIAVGLLASAFPMLVATDWGRYIYLLLTISYISYWTAVKPRLLTEVTNIWDTYSIANQAAFAFLYASTWQAAHYVLPGKSAFLPGAVFRVLKEPAAMRSPDEPATR